MIHHILKTFCSATLVILKLAEQNVASKIYSLPHQRNSHVCNRDIAFLHGKTQLHMIGINDELQRNWYWPVLSYCLSISIKFLWGQPLFGSVFAPKTSCIISRLADHYTATSPTPVCGIIHVSRQRPLLSAHETCFPLFSLQHCRFCTLTRISISVISGVPGQSAPHRYCRYRTQWPMPWYLVDNHEIYAQTVMSNEGGGMIILISVLVVLVFSFSQVM